MNSEKARQIIEFHTVLCHACNKSTLFEDAVELMKISTAISNLEIARCNYTLSARQETRRRNLLEKARAICANPLYYGGVARIEVPDPRAGCGIRLHLKDGCYNNFGGEGWNVPTL